MMFSACHADINASNNTCEVEHVGYLPVSCDSRGLMASDIIFCLSARDSFEMLTFLLVVSATFAF